MASISERENRKVEAANASGDPPVAFIHGPWLLPSSWRAWADFFEQTGYAPLTPDWPDDPATVEAARANPAVLAKKTLKQAAEHTTEIINGLDKKPAVIGTRPRLARGRPDGARLRQALRPGQAG